jgi:negative regulator of sigma E activity
MTDRDPWTARLSEYVDGELAADERVELERHLTICGECRTIVADLGRLRDLAATLVDREPDRDLWPAINARIGGEPRVLPLRRRWAFTLPQLAAAAVLMLVVGAGGAAVALRGNGPTTVAGPAAIGPVDPAAVPIALAASTSFDHAVAELEQVLAERRDRLDTATVRVLEQSLRTIDRALAQARAALVTDPNDAYLNAHLAETMRRKLNLMRRAATLVAAS